jgi:hypothetical protein
VSRFGTTKPNAAHKRALEQHNQNLHGQARNALTAAQKASSDPATRARYQKAMDALGPEEGPDDVKDYALGKV